VLSPFTEGDVVGSCLNWHEEEKFFYARKEKVRGTHLSLSAREGMKTA